MGFCLIVYTIKQQKGQKPMLEIIALFAVLNPCISKTTIRQLCQVVFALLAMTGRVTMLNISRWTSKGGSYRTIQRFFNTVLPWTTMCWSFFRTHLLDRESVYILAGDEVVRSKHGKCTYGLSRFFSSLHGKSIPGLSFLAVSLVSVSQRRSYPMAIEQIVRCEETSEPVSSPTEPLDDTKTTKSKRGRPKGSRNKNKKEVVLSDTLKQLQTILKEVLQEIDNLIPIHYFVLDGYFGNNNALQMVEQCGLHLISKLRTDAALHLPPTTQNEGRGRPAIYGERFNPRQIDAKYCVSTQIDGKVKTEIYQMELRHKKFPEPLNVVCVLKTNLTTEKQVHVLLFSSDLELDAEKLIDYYSLRFQIEFNFRDAKQHWGMEDFMNVNKTPINNAVNLSMFMTNVSAKLMEDYRCQIPDYSVIDLKSHYRGLKYTIETLKILPQKPEDIVIEQIIGHLSSIGAIHNTQANINPG